MNPCFSSFIVKKNLYQENHDRNHNHWNTVSTEKDILHIQVGIPYQLRKIYSIYRLEYRINWERYTPYTGWNTVSTEKDILHIHVIIPYQLRKIYSIYRLEYRINWERYTPYTGWNTVSTEKDILHIQVLLQCIHM